MDGDLVDAAAVLQRQHHIHVAGVTEHGVHAIEVRLGLMADVELRAAGVAAGMGHRQGAGLVLLGVDLAVDLIAGPPVPAMPRAPSRLLGQPPWAMKPGITR